MGDDLNTRVFIAPPTFSSKRGEAAWTDSSRAGKGKSLVGALGKLSRAARHYCCARLKKPGVKYNPSCGGVNVWERSWRRKFESKQNCWIKIKQWLFPAKRRIVADILWWNFFIRKMLNFECLSFEKFLGNSIKDIKQSLQQFCERREKNFKVFDEVF